MKDKILFCNIGWMEKYIGVTEDDKPTKGGEDLTLKASGGEAYNFLDDNGKCYGFVMTDGNIALENYYKDIKSTDEYVDDVLVVWIATNDKKETKIVGWYKDAKVYRAHQEAIFFTDLNRNRNYNIVANAIDSYLLPEGNRTFEIDRANEVVADNSFEQSNIWNPESEDAKAEIVTEVIKYIESYKEIFSNFVYHSDFIEKRIENIKFLNDFNKLYEEGLKEYDENYYYDALIYFKAAQRIEEPIEMLKVLGESLFYLLRNDEAIELFHRIISLEGETMDSLIFLTHSYDWNENIEKTLEYANRLINFPSNRPEDREEKIYTYEVIFNIYVYENRLEEAEENIDNLYNYLKNTSDYSREDIDDQINPMREYLEEKSKN